MTPPPTRPQTSPTPRAVLGSYEDMLRGARQGATVYVPEDAVTMVTRMARRLFVEKNLKVKAAAAAKE